jgi:hypothetical protein
VILATARATPDSAEDDHAEEPSSICARDREDDDRRDVRQAIVKDEAERDEPTEDQRAGGSARDRARESS